MPLPWPHLLVVCSFSSSLQPVNRAINGNPEAKKGAEEKEEKEKKRKKGRKEKTKTRNKDKR